MRKYYFYISTVFALKTMNTIFFCWQWCVKITLFLWPIAVLRIRIRPIRDPVPFWVRDPGWVKNQDPDPGSGFWMNNPDHISEIFPGSATLENYQFPGGGGVLNIRFQPKYRHLRSVLRIRIRIPIILVTWIRIQIRIKVMTSQNVWNMSLF